jgi:hypothetical protein
VIGLNSPSPRKYPRARHLSGWDDFDLRHGTRAVHMDGHLRRWAFGAVVAA